MKHARTRDDDLFMPVVFTFIMHDKQAGYVGLVCSHPEYRVTGLSGL